MYKYISTFVLLAVSSAVLSGCLGRGVSDSGAGAASMLVSTDGGQTFVPRVGAGDGATIASANVLTIARDVSDNRVMYLGTQKNGILMTRDSGELWQKITFLPEKVYGVAVDTNDSRTIYATGVFEGFGRIYKTADGGENWTKVYSEATKGTVITSLAMNPREPKTLYAGTSKGSILKTNDGGASWKSLGNIKSPVRFIRLDAKDPQTVYFGLYEKGLMKTRDGGTTLENYTKKLAGDKDKSRSVGLGTSKRRSTKLYSLEVDPNNGGVVYVGTEQGVYKSVDYGNNWEELDIITAADRLPVKAIAINPHNAEEIIYSVARSLYRRVGDGAEWTPVQISTSRVASVVQYDPVNDGVIYVGMLKLKK